MFKILIATATVLGLMVGTSATVQSQPAEPLDAVKVWSIRSWERLQLQIQNHNGEDPDTGEKSREQIRGQFREELQDQARNQLRIHQTTTAEPPQLNPNNPWTDDTPMPYSGHGAGKGSCGSNCDPAEPLGPNGNGSGGKGH